MQIADNSLSDWVFVVANMRFGCCDGLDVESREVLNRSQLKA
jgi:hypothetical protein